MKSRTIVFGVIVLALVLSGCSQRMIDFSVISSKNVSIATKAKGSMSEGEDWSHWFLFIPVNGNIIPSLEEAVDRAIETAGPEYDALMDGVVYSKFYWALIAFGNGFPAGPQTKPLRPLPSSTFGTCWAPAWCTAAIVRLSMTTIVTAIILVLMLPPPSAQLTVRASAAL